MIRRIVAAAQRLFIDLTTSRANRQELAAWAQSITEHARESEELGITDRARQQIRDRVTNSNTGDDR